MNKYVIKLSNQLQLIIIQSTYHLLIMLIGCLHKRFVNNKHNVLVYTAFVMFYLPFNTVYCAQNSSQNDKPCKLGTFNREASHNVHL